MSDTRLYHFYSVDSPGITLQVSMSSEEFEQLKAGNKLVFGTVVGQERSVQFSTKSSLAGTNSDKAARAIGWGAAHGSPLDVQVAGDHYKSLAIQPVEYIHANQIPFIEGSVIKYVTRWKNKGGVNDLQKAKHFTELLIELETRKSDNEKGLSPSELHKARNTLQP